MLTAPNNGTGSTSEPSETDERFLAYAINNRGLAQSTAGNVAEGLSDLRRALELYEEGVSLSRFCNEKLEEAERRVEILSKAADKTMKEMPFASQADGE